jgi:hypothetical protein
MHWCRTDKQLCDMTSRPTALAIGLLFFTVGYIVVAASQSVENLAGGQVLYTIGNTGLNFGRSFRNSVPICH